MDIVWFLVGVSWILGWVRELATVERIVQDTDLQYPFKGARLVIAVLFAVSWPYWYFYRKTRLSNS